jgi:hypothetical protein
VLQTYLKSFENQDVFLTSCLFLYPYMTFLQHVKCSRTHTYIYAYTHIIYTKYQTCFVGYSSVQAYKVMLFKCRDNTYAIFSLLIMLRDGFCGQCRLGFVSRDKIRSIDSLHRNVNFITKFLAEWTCVPSRQYADLVYRQMNCMTNHLNE